jgi:undecaprenyl-diphosphatase
MSRLEATRFSFLLAIPVTLGVGSKKSLELLKADGVVDWLPVFIGCATAFVTGLLVIHFSLAFMQKRTLWPFIWYGVILACLVGYISFIA